MKKIFALVLLIIVIIGSVYFINQKKTIAPGQTATTGSNNTPQHQGPSTNCGMTITSPTEGSTVTFPLSIDATVDNTNAQSLGCSWGVFEAQAGNVQVKDPSGNILAQVPLTTTDNWMTTGPVAYTATIASLSNPAYSGPLTLLFTEDNSSGKPNPDTLTIQIVK
jgi:hypothetical protein